MGRFNPFAPDVLPDPYPRYHELRATDPVHWGCAGDPHRDGTWYLFRHADVVSVFKDPRFGREVQSVLPPDRLLPISEEHRPLAQMSDHWMILRDPPEHTRLRRLVNKAFTARMIERIIPRITIVANALLDAAQERGQFDLIADYSRLLPLIIIAEILGIPSSDFRRFMPWSIALAATIDLRQSDQIRRRGTEALLALNDYLRELIAQRYHAPQNDLISALIAAKEQGRQLSEEDILGTITMLLTAGNDPIMHLIGNGVLSLLRHPDQLALLRREPELIGRAVDELLRYDSSVQMTFRYALEDVELGGRCLRAGDHVALVLGAMLRDPAFYDAPDTLDIRRESNYLPFGLGIHFCLGAALARAEGQIAINTLLQRFPNLTLATEQLEWQETAAVRGVKALPVTF